VPLLPLVGHAALRERLLAARQRGALPSSLLLTGPRGVGKQRLALWLGQALLCATPGPGGVPCDACQACRFALAGTHPDLHWLYPRPRLKDGDASAADVQADLGDATAERLGEQRGLWGAPAGSEGLYVATMRAVVQRAAVSPAIGRRKVFVVGDAERMVPQEGADAAANAFLKLLEEPPADTTLILTSSEPGALLPTIRSRVVALRLAPLPADDVRRFLAHPVTVPAGRTEKDGTRQATVAELLAGRGVSGDLEALVARAQGAPGALVAAGGAGAARAEAERLLRAALDGTRADRFRGAFGQGASRARGAFSDVLDALTERLHALTRDVVSRHPARALAAARAMDAVERAKARAAGNVSPQLVTAELLREMTAVFR
jgi:DNA polymerase-3 subunit delta'